MLQVSVSNGGVPKRAVDSAHVGWLGLEGDAHREDTVHGGPTRAVCLFAVEVIERLQVEGHPVEPGGVGENLTTSGIEWSSLPVGTRVRIGNEVVLELTLPAMPCDTQRANFLRGEVSRISFVLHPGDSRVYARVVSEGVVRPGDAIELLPPDPASDAGRLETLARHEQISAAGYLALWHAARASGFDVRILDDGELTVAASPDLRSFIYNEAVTGLRTLPHLLPRVLDHFRAAGVRGVIESPTTPWPDATSAGARAVLAARAAQTAERWAGHDVPGVTVRAVDASEWSLVQRAMYGDSVDDRLTRTLPHLLASRGVSSFVAFDGDRPVGTGTLVTRWHSGSLVMGVVLPEARGRGIQRAIIAARVAAAIEAGCDLLVAEADADSTSERNLQRLGFERLRVAHEWFFDPAHDPCPGAHRTRARARRPGRARAGAPGRCRRMSQLRLERSGPDGVVARVSLARPEAHNALDASSFAEIQRIFATLERESPMALRAVCWQATGHPSASAGTLAGCVPACRSIARATSRTPWPRRRRSTPSTAAPYPSSRASTARPSAAASACAR